MRIATCRRGQETQAIRLDSDGSCALLPWADVGALLTAADDSDVQWQELVASTPDAGRVEPDELEFAPVVPKPSKIVCVGLNYAKHITEMGRELPEFPTLFAERRKISRLREIHGRFTRNTGAHAHMRAHNS